MREFRGKKRSLNCLYLTGASGAGKSIFLENFLKEKFKDEQMLYFNEYDIACDLIFQEVKGKQPEYVIMDQFEKGLENKDIYVYIRKMIEECSNEIIFIFSFPQEFFDQIYKSVHIHILDANGRKEEIQENTCTHFLGCDEYNN